MYSTRVQDLYNKATNKRQLILLVADSFKMNPKSVQSNWFSGFCQIPEKHEGRLVDIMNNYINVESKVLTH
jgi:hypothetical protein|tara:strand:- start:285 stop:497 length:213 start_codon:yes stop_codon:yes gene_type:complete